VWGNRSIVKTILLSFARAGLTKIYLFFYYLIGFKGLSSITLGLENLYDNIL
jgi:hypothetical protein